MSDYRERLNNAHQVIVTNCIKIINPRISDYYKKFMPLYEQCMKLSDNEPDYHYAEYLKLLLWVGLSKLIGINDTKELLKQAEKEKELAIVK